MPNHFYKVGTNKLLRHSLNANSRRNVDTHNGYGFRQQKYLSRNFYAQQKFFSSPSNIPASGKFGNVGRWVDWIDATDDPTTVVKVL